MRRNSRSKSGCISGSPPLKVITLVPNAASMSMRRCISNVGTGSDTESYSLQYVQAKLQRRVGIMWTTIG